jgi:hypothetical protein
MINQFEIKWVKTPVEDILGVASLAFQCDWYCKPYGPDPDTCGIYCLNYSS